MYKVFEEIGFFLGALVLIAIASAGFTTIMCWLVIETFKAIV